MSLVERLECKAKTCDRALTLKLVQGDYDVSLCELRNLMEDAAKRIRRDEIVLVKLGAAFRKKKR